MEEGACEIQEHLDCPESVIPILNGAKTVAVLGCSGKPDRDSYRVARYLQEQGYRIIPVNPVEEKILGETVYPDLKSVPVPVDVVDVFRSPDHLPSHQEEMLSIRPAVVWMQQGAVHEGVAERLEEAGIRVVKNRCMMAEHKIHSAQIRRD